MFRLINALLMLLLCNYCAVSSTETPDGDSVVIEGNKNFLQFIFSSSFELLYSVQKYKQNLIFVCIEARTIIKCTVDLPYMHFVCKLLTYHTNNSIMFQSKITFKNSSIIGIFIELPTVVKCVFVFRFVNVEI